MPSAPDDVLQLCAKYQRRLYLYILSMLPNPADAEDVLQNTNVVVWQKLHQFQPGTDFRAWAFQICYYEVCKFRGRHRQAGLSFSPELLDELAVEHQRRETLLETRQAALPDCMQRLPTPDRDLIEAVYGRGLDVPRLAEQMGREPTSVYRSLRRIRQWLYDCIERAARQEMKP
jgi:RNA polymerase sigma-70 factor, ECF subfamily